MTPPDTTALHVKLITVLGNEGGFDGSHYTSDSILKAIDAILALIADEVRAARVDELTQAEVAFTNNELKERIVGVFHQYLSERLAKLEAQERE